MMKINSQSKKQLIKPMVWLWQKQLFNCQQQEKGQTLVIAFMLGVIILGATILGVLRSSQSKTNVQVDEYTKRAIATAEQGITQFTEDLNSEYRGYLKLDYDPNNGVNEWETPPNTADSPICSAPAIQNGIIPEVDLGKGRGYKVQRYVYDSATDTGELTIKGNEQKGSLNSQAQIQIDLNISEMPRPGAFPGLYGSDFVALGNGDVEGGGGNVVCTNCAQTYGLDQSDCINGQLDLAKAIDQKSGGTVSGEIILGNPKLPPVPDVPKTNCAVNTTVDCFIVLNSITSDTNLPRPIDKTLLGVVNGTPGTYRTFYYVLKNTGNPKYTSIKSNANLNVDSSTGSVRLYVTGNYNQAGTAATSNNGTLEKLAIFGCTDNLHNLDIDNDSTGDNNCITPYTDQQIAISGGSTTTNLLIYAPFAQIGINGGSGDPVVNGVVWGRTWGKYGSDGVGSSSNVANVFVPGNAEQLLENEFGTTFSNLSVRTNRITGKGSWQRVEATP